MVNSKLCNDSTNPMCRATFLGYKNIVVILMKHGADVNQCSENGRTPLMWAAYRNNFRTMDFLLENGADTSIRDKTGLNAFEMATTLVNYECALMLKQRAGMDTPKEERQALYDDNGGQVVNGLYRQKFDFELFFHYLDNNVVEVERQSFYDKLRKQREEWETKDLVVDVRETWGEWVRRQRDFDNPPLIPREELPVEYQPHRSFYGKVSCYMNGIDPYPQEDQPKVEPLNVDLEEETKNEVHQSNEQII